MTLIFYGFFFLHWYIIESSCRYCQNNLSCQWIVINRNYIRNNFFLFIIFLVLKHIYIFFFSSLHISSMYNAIKISSAILFMMLLINVAVMCCWVHCVWCIKLNVDDTAYWFLIDFSIIFTPPIIHTQCSLHIFKTKRLDNKENIVLLCSHIRKVLSEIHQMNCFNKVPW